jgi:hypothetical protein
VEQKQLFPITKPKKEPRSEDLFGGGRLTGRIQERSAGLDPEADDETRESTIATRGSKVGRGCHREEIPKLH